MRISKLSITNYRNFKDFEIKLKQFNLIIGENNIGKTNLLNAIGLIFSPDVSFFQKRVLEIDDIHYATVLQFKKQVVEEPDFSKINFPAIKIKVVLSDFKSNSDQLAIVGDWLTLDNNTTSAIGDHAKITYEFSKSRIKELEKWFCETKKEIKGKEKPEDFVDFPIDYYSYTLYGGDNPIKRIDFAWLNFLKMEYLDALRDAKTHLLAGSRNSLLFKVLKNETENKIGNIKDKLLKLKEEIDSEESTFSSISNQIEEYLKQISIEEEDGLIKFQFTDIETSEILKRLSLIYGTDPISIARNGLGRNNLLYISLLLSQLVKNADKKKIFFRIIGIEEPEAHIHPHQQIHLAKNIESEENDERQVIITSHSTHITSQLSLDDTIVLYRDDKESKIKPYYLSNYALPKDTKRYLQKYLDATKSTMFFARIIIMVEGISEQLLIPEFFKLHHSQNKTIEQCRISLINVNGVAFEHFLRIIKGGYFIKGLVITDSDADKTTKHRVPTLKRAYRDVSYIDIKSTEFEATFEKELIKSNETGNGKELLMLALDKTKPYNAKKLQKTYAEKELEIQPFFDEIENYKSGFAMNLLEVLQAKENKEIRKDFIIPKYITDGFDFIMKKDNPCG